MIAARAGAPTDTNRISQMIQRTSGSSGRIVTLGNPDVAMRLRLPQLLLAQSVPLHRRDE